MDAATGANVLFAGVAVFGAVLSGLAVAAFRRTRSPRMALVAAGFLLLMVQGVIVGVGLFAGGWDPLLLLLVSAGFELALLGVLFAATLLR